MALEPPKPVRPTCHRDGVGSSDLIGLMLSAPGGGPMLWVTYLGFRSARAEVTAAAQASSLRS